MKKMKKVNKWTSQMMGNERWSDVGPKASIFGMQARMQEQLEIQDLLHQSTWLWSKMGWADRGAPQNTGAPAGAASPVPCHVLPHGCRSKQYGRADAPQWERVEGFAEAAGAEQGRAAWDTGTAVQAEGLTHSHTGDGEEAAACTRVV
jgi:hypothetical protein